MNPRKSNQPVQRKVNISERYTNTGDIDQSISKSILIDPKKKNEKVLCLSFNQKKDCIAMGTNFGYKIYNAKNYRLIGERDLDMPISRIQMLFRSNLLLLVRSSQDNMAIPGNTLIFWDDKANDTTGMLTLKHTINKIKMRKDYIYIIHEKSFQIFSLETLQMIKKIETKLNPYGRILSNLSYLCLFLRRHHKKGGFSLQRQEDRQFRDYEPL